MTLKDKVLMILNKPVSCSENRNENNENGVKQISGVVLSGGTTSSPIRTSLWIYELVRMRMRIGLFL